MATVAVFAIFINALFLQRGPHPAPIFATRPLMKQAAPVALPRPRAAEPGSAPMAVAGNQAQIVGDIQRALSRKGFYDGVVDGIWGAKTDAAARDFVQTAGLNINAEASDSLLRAIVAANVRAPGEQAALPAPAHNDPIATLLAPSKRVMAIQRALADFGYGQIKPTGVVDAETRAAIEKFERDRGMPADGQISQDFVRALAAMSGRPLD